MYNKSSKISLYLRIGSEGFSITPREALAMKKPCILSNNTAHKKMCAKKYAYGVKSEIKESAYYNIFGKDVDFTVTFPFTVTKKTVDIFIKSDDSHNQSMLAMYV